MELELPKLIYLQVEDEHNNVLDVDEMTWHVDRVYPSDAVYVLSEKFFASSLNELRRFFAWWLVGTPEPDWDCSPAWLVELRDLLMER